MTTQHKPTGDIAVPVSFGELVDKITILEIKQRNVCDSTAKRNIDRELSMLDRLARPLLQRQPELTPIKQELSSVNEALWRIEDDIRSHERDEDFNNEFIALARQVYIRNDERARLKKRINLLTNSPIVEEKLYAAY